MVLGTYILYVQKLSMHTHTRYLTNILFKMQKCTYFEYHLIIPRVSRSAEKLPCIFGLDHSAAGSAGSAGSAAPAAHSSAGLRGGRGLQTVIVIETPRPKAKAKERASPTRPTFFCSLERERERENGGE